MDTTVAGVVELRAACDKVAAALTAPATAAAAARAVAEAGRPNIPRDTGALARSETVTATATGARLDYTAYHALPVHTLRPWVPAAIDAAEPTILALYTDSAATAWS
jgi:hypothetical protein